MLVHSASFQAVVQPQYHLQVSLADAPMKNLSLLPSWFRPQAAPHVMEKYWTILSHVLEQDPAFYKRWRITVPWASRFVWVCKVGFSKGLSSEAKSSIHLPPPALQ